MNPFELIVVVLLLVAVGKFLQTQMGNRGNAPEQSAETIDTLRMQDEIRNLRERIQVLERVITDNHNSVDLDREIERLRDR